MNFYLKYRLSRFKLESCGKTFLLFLLETLTMRFNLGSLTILIDERKYLKNKNRKMGFALL